MDWSEDKTASRTTYVMDADRRYMVERWGLGSWTSWFDGYRISPDDASLGSRTEAQAFAEGHRNSPESKLERLGRLTRTVLDEYEAAGHGAYVDLDLLAGWREQYSELTGEQS